MKHVRVDDLHKQWMKDVEYRHEYESLETEFSLTTAMIEARALDSRNRKSPSA